MRGGETAGGLAWIITATMAVAEMRPDSMSDGK